MQIKIPKAQRKRSFCLTDYIRGIVIASSVMFMMKKLRYLWTQLTRRWRNMCLTNNNFVEYNKRSFCFTDYTHVSLSRHQLRSWWRTYGVYEHDWWGDSETCVRVLRIITSWNTSKDLFVSQIIFVVSSSRHQLRSWWRSYGVYEHNWWGDGETYVIWI